MEKLIQNGKVGYGIRATGVDEVNYLDFAEPNAMGKALKNWQKKAAYKHFQYFGVISPQLLMGCAMVQIVHSAVLFCYVFLPQERRLFEYQFSDYGRLFTRTSTSPNQGESRFARGKNLIVFENQKSLQQRRLLIDIGSLQADVTFQEHDFAPMCITTRAGAGGFVYAQKAAGIACHGEVVIEGQRFDAQQQPFFAHHDWSGGFMRRETFWNWACFSGTVGGQVVGLNVSCGVNETSFTENCFWIDGRLFKIDSVIFDYDRWAPMQPWHIRSFDGQLHLTFTPLGMHREYRQLIIAKSNFKQLFGYFHGNIGSIKIDKIHGFVEDQYAMW